MRRRLKERRRPRRWGEAAESAKQVDDEEEDKSSAHEQGVTGVSSRAKRHKQVLAGHS